MGVRIWQPNGYSQTKSSKCWRKSRRRGFAEVREYVLRLIEADAEQHGASLGLHDALLAEIDDDPVESFHEGWDEVMRGEKMLTEEEFWQFVKEGN